MTRCVLSRVNNLNTLGITIKHMSNHALKDDTTVPLLQNALQHTNSPTICRVAIIFQQRM